MDGITLISVSILAEHNPLINGPVVLLVLAALFGIGLTIASVRLKVETDPRIKEILSVIPGANCGGCGFPNCEAFAKAVVEGNANVDGCVIGGADCARRIAQIMGVEVNIESLKKHPIVHCAARKEDRKGGGRYIGVKRCAEANVIVGVEGCTYGCIGFGDCVEACRYDALKLIDGRPHFDYSKCTSCGACLRACPRNLIEIITFKDSSMLVVGCANRDPARVVRKVCEVGCIGCGACARANPEIFTVEDNLAKINYHKYTNIEELKDPIEKCPAKMLIVFALDGKQYVLAKDMFAEKLTTA